MAAGQTATVDLYLALPAAAQGAQDGPSFDALWTMHAGAAAITTRTPFERFLAPTPAQDQPAAASPYGERPAPTNPTLVPDAVPRARCPEVSDSRRPR